MPASRSRLLRLLAVLAALAFLSTACGGDDSGTDDAGTTDGSETDGSTDSSDDDDDGGDAGLPNPCDLITLAEMDAAFGFAWAEGEYAAPDVAPIASCTWSDADPAMPAKVVSLSVGNDAGYEEQFNQTVKQVFDSTKELLEEGDILEDDLGLGEASYRTAAGIYVLDGDTSYSFTTIGGVSDEAVAGLKEMASTVVDG